MIKEGIGQTSVKSLVILGCLFVLISLIVVRVMPNTRVSPDLALILTIYCALYLRGERGVILPIFSGAYVGSFSAFPAEYMVLYGMLYFGIRLIASFFQMRFFGYPIFLSIILEIFVGVIHALEIYLKLPDVFSLVVVTKIITFQSMLTALFLYPVFLIFNRFSQGPLPNLRRVLK